VRRSDSLCAYVDIRKEKRTFEDLVAESLGEARQLRRISFSGGPHSKPGRPFYLLPTG